jgi:protein CpxP
MTSSRTVLTIAAAAALATGLAWNPLAQAQSSGMNTTPPPSAAPPAATAQSPSAAPITSAPAASASAQNAKPRSDAQVEARITQLHRELKITPAQETDWNTLAQDMRDNAHQMSSLIQERAGNSKTKPMNAVDDLKSYEKIADAHSEGLKKIVPDFERLYDSMAPAQKKTADTVFNQRVNQRVRQTAAPSSPAGHS